MRVSPSDKQAVYLGLSQLLRSGIPFPRALDKLLSASRGSICHLIGGLRQSILDGHTIGEAFHLAAPIVSPMEASVITSLERGGKLEHGFQQLAGYFEALALARKLILRKSAYPIFVLHFGIFSMALPKLMEGGTGAVLWSTAPTLAIVYAGALVAALFLPSLRDFGTNSPALDRLARTLPMLGKVRSCFANARFCMIYGIELNAGVNVIDSLIAAGRASRSALIQRAVSAALPHVLAGSQVGPLLAASRAFPENLARSILLGEESGALDKELERLASHYQAEALIRLQSTAEAFAKLLYFTIVSYIAFRIVSSFQETVAAQSKLLDF